MQNILAQSATNPRLTDEPQYKNFTQQQHPTTRALLVHISGSEVDSIPDSGAIYINGDAVTPKYAVIDHSVSGDNTLVSAVVGKKIRVLALMMIAGGTVNARFESGAGGTALSGQMQLTAQAGFTLPYNPAGWFETASNTLLNLELSAAISVDGMLTYVEV